MNDDLDQLLTNLKLRRMHTIAEREIEHALAHQSGYQEFLARLLREEWQHRQEQSLRNRIYQARLPERWSLDTFPFKQQPSVKQATIRELADLDFVVTATNVVFIGPTGVGKTGLACGLLLKALQNGRRGLFIRAQDLFDEMYASLADRSTRRLLDRLVRIEVLLIDELGYLNLRPEQANIFFKLMEERYAKKPTLITTNLDYPDWYDLLGNKKMVEALLDRLRHRCHTLRIEGVSLRSPQS